MAIINISTDLAKDLNAAADRHNALIYLMQNVLVRGDVQDGVTTGDYGIVPYCGQKPILFKQGAEKLAQAFSLRVVLKKTAQVLESDFAHYEFEATVYGRAIADQITTHTAICNSEEKGIAAAIAKQKSTPRGFAHNIACRAEKRAYVGAVVKALAATQFFAWEQTGVETLPVDDSPYAGITVEVEPIDTVEGIRQLAAETCKAVSISTKDLQKLAINNGLPASSADMSWDQAKDLQRICLIWWLTSRYTGLGVDKAMQLIDQLPTGGPLSQVAMLTGQLENWQPPMGAQAKSITHNGLSIE